MRISFVILIILSYAIGCNDTNVEPLNGARVIESPKHDDPRCVEANAKGGCKAYAISLCELLANSEKYHNKKVNLGGYVVFEFEGNALYATRDHFENQLVKDAIWIDVKGLNLGKYADFRKGYAYIGGIFDRNDGGHLIIFSGAIKEVDFFQPIKARKKDT